MQISRPRKQKPANYPEADLQSIAEAIGKDVGDLLPYQKHFKAAAHWYGVGTASPKRIAPSKMQKKLLQISKSARRLLLNLGIDDPADATDGPGDIIILAALSSVDGETEDSVARATEKIGRIVEILEAIEAAQKLERLAEEAITDVTRLGKFAAPKRHQGDAKVNDWIESMMSIYVKVTGEPPATSVGAPERPDEGIAGGPLTRFLEASGAPLGIEYTSDAWRSRVRTILDNAPCPLKPSYSASTAA